MIRNVVFDVGGVLVRLRYQPFVDYLSAAGIDMTDLPGWLAKVDLAAHERGALSGEELLGRVAAMASRPLDAGELAARWLDMFDRAQEMLDLAAGLMRDHRVYLLSNVGDMHWRHLNAEYGLERVAHGVLTSFEAGAVKPQPEIYELGAERIGIEPAACVFVDDLRENVAGAEAGGMTAILHRDPETTIQELERLLGIPIAA